MFVCFVFSMGAFTVTQLEGDVAGFFSDGHLRSMSKFGTNYLRHMLNYKDLCLLYIYIYI